MTRILVAEDGPLVAANLARALEAAGYEVAQVGNGAEAWAQLQRRTPDLLVTDVGMPVMDGFELIGKVRRHGYAIPILAITGLGAIGGVAYADLAIKLGADRVLEKPFTMRTFIVAIEGLLE